MRTYEAGSAAEKTSILATDAKTLILATSNQLSISDGVDRVRMAARKSKNQNVTGISVVLYASYTRLDQ
jgi:hypothetical protein